MAPLVLVLLACGGGAPPPRLDRPNRVLALPDGGFWVSDFHHHRLVRFDADGRYVESVGARGTGSGRLWRAWGLALDASGRLVVLHERPVEEGRLDRREVKVFRDGRQDGVFPIRAPDPAGRSAELGFCSGIARLDGGWVVAATGDNALVRLDAGWGWAEERAAPEGGPPFEAPADVAADGDSVWVVEQFPSRLRRLDAQLHQELLLELEGPGPGRLLYPSAVAACPGRWIAVADLGDYRVERFAEDGSWIGGFAPEPAGPDRPVQLLDIAVSEDCTRLYLADSKGDRVLVVTPEGEPIREVSAW